MMPIRSSILVLALAILASALIPTSVPAEKLESTIEPGRSWLHEKAAYYEAHPELKTTPGSGWKPYNRIKWGYELNLVDGRGPARLPRAGLFRALLRLGSDRRRGGRPEPGRWGSTRGVLGVGGPCPWRYLPRPIERPTAIIAPPLRP